jgi:hypothetical protein
MKENKQLRTLDLGGTFRGQKLKEMRAYNTICM